MDTLPARASCTAGLFAQVAAAMVRDDLLVHDGVGKNSTYSRRALESGQRVWSDNIGGAQ